MAHGSWNEDEERFIVVPGQILVFGSNLAGRHGRGAALFARLHYGARYGVGVGPTGRAYAIPTKDRHLRTLPLLEIAPFVRDFLEYAADLERQCFKLTRVGCGLAGYKDHQMAPMFRGVSSNVLVPEEWKPYVCDNARVL